MIATKISVRSGLTLLVATMVAAVPAAAQDGTTGSPGTGSTLSSQLRTFADNPRSLSALMGAGRAAFDLGDMQAALTFFAKAEEIAPSDGRIKMWMGSALVQLENPSAALKLFEKAASLGVPEADIGRDRGLAFDMIGDTVRAQRDYSLVLQRGSDPEVTRRMALSLAISGKREPALKLLEAQLQRRDPAAWRSRAFILALTGDTEGAKRAAQAVMPEAQATALEPFLARLPSLTPADRAMAVHFGRIAGTGQPSLAQATGQGGPVPPNSPATTDAGKPDNRQTALGTPAGASLASRSTEPLPGVRREVVPPVTGTHPSSPGPAPAALAPVEARPVEPMVKVKTDAAAATALVQVARRQESPKLPPASGRAAAIAIPSANTSGTSPPAVQPKPAEPASIAPETRSGLADLSDVVAALQDDPRPAKPSPGRESGRVQSASRSSRLTGSAAPRAKPKSVARARAAERRHWVQIAGGASKATLPREFARLKSKAPALLGNREGWSTPLNATNRLLVGPFDSEAEAQELVNALAKADVAAFSWTSSADQEIERLPAK